MTNMDDPPTPFKAESPDEVEYQTDEAESCTTTRSSTPPSSPLTAVLSPKNPWAKRLPSKTEEGQVNNFLSIMAQQEKYSTVEPAQRKNSVRFEDNTAHIPNEEEMIRLAIEASLRETEETRNDYDLSPAIEDEIDDDLKLALQLSMAEVNNTANSVTVEPDDLKMPYEGKASDKKQAADHHNYDRKPQAKEVEFEHETQQEMADGFTYMCSEISEAACLPTMTASAASPSCLTDKEHEAIAKAIMEADDKAQAESLKLAMELQAEENREYERMKVDQVKNNAARSNVRTVTKSEFEGLGLQSDSTTGNRKIWSQADYDDHHEQYEREIRFQDCEKSNHADESSPGYQMNSSTPSKDWSRLDRNTILGPNNELRTKHDVILKNQSNADRLLGGAKSSMAKKGGTLSVSDTAFNSLNQTLKKRGMVKGVERSGTGRAENMNEKTRGGAMDGNVRLLITKAINNGLIQHCNGIVKEGKEAVIYHAEAGSQSDGFDVAIKVFKRIQEFKNRNMYIDNDPRYYGKKFRNADKREQVELWTEKEYRNLVRAQRAGIAVPTPLMQKDNVLFMRFLGDGGWPAAQLRELELKKGSKKWTILYVQTIVAIRKLYHCARLVHGDLSEFNILVCPMSQVENAMDKSDEARDSLQIVLIDFGQAVERKHPSAPELLRRDLSHVNRFFVKQNIVTLSNVECTEFVVEDMLNNEDNDGDGEEIDELDEVNVSDLVQKHSDDAWRYNIEGWSDAKDLDRFESLVKKAKKEKI